MQVELLQIIVVFYTNNCGDFYLYYFYLWQYTTYDSSTCTKSVLVACPFTKLIQICSRYKLWINYFNSKYKTCNISATLGVFITASAYYLSRYFYGYYNIQSFINFKHIVNTHVECRFYLII